MSSWIEDAVGVPDEEKVDEGEQSDMADSGSFKSQLQAIVAAGNSTISRSLLEDNLDQIDDVDLLERVKSHVDTEEKESLVSERLFEVRGGTDEVEDEVDESAVETPDEAESEEADDDPDPDESEIDSFEEFDDAVRQGVLDGSIEHIDAEYFEEYVGDLDDPVVEKVVEQNDDLEISDDVLELFEDVYESDESDEDLDDVWSGSDDAETEIETDVGDTSDTSSPDEEIDESGAQTPETATEDDADDDWASAFDEASADSGGVDVTEAAAMENRWTMLVWSEPGKGKTHFGYSTKEPVVIIDTENKAHNLADKFTDKKVKIFQPSNYDEALDALHDALDLLHDVKEKTGRTGTLVVDSMSIMWEWSQQKYVDKFYRGKDVDEVEFSSAMGSGGQSDWKQIKRYHNTKFRQQIIDSPFHFVWTAMSTEAYDVAIEEGLDWTPMKPSGEKNNEYKASEVLRLREDEEGVTVGELEKSDKVNHKYTGLKKPTFPKHQEVVEAISDAEQGGRSLDSVEREFGVEVFDGNPRTARINEDR